MLLRTFVTNKNANPIAMILFTFESLPDIFPGFCKPLDETELYGIVDFGLPVYDCWLNPELFGLIFIMCPCRILLIFINLILKTNNKNNFIRYFIIFIMHLMFSHYFTWFLSFSSLWRFSHINSLKYHLFYIHFLFLYQNPTNFIIIFITNDHQSLIRFHCWGTSLLIYYPIVYFGETVSVSFFCSSFSFFSSF